MRGPLLFIFNFHPTDSYEGYRIGVEEAGEYQVGYGKQHVVLLCQKLVPTLNFVCFLLYRCVAITSWSCGYEPRN